MPDPAHTQVSDLKISHWKLVLVKKKKKRGAREAHGPSHCKLIDRIKNKESIGEV